MREHLTVEDFQKIAADLDALAAAVRKIPPICEEFGLPSVLLHSASVTGHWIPAILAWAEKAEVDAKTQGRAHRLGRRSRAELDKGSAQRRATRTRAAKKAEEQKRETDRKRK
jgi:hypothetical protein